MIRNWISKNRYQIEFKDGSIKRIHADLYEQYSNVNFYRYYQEEGKVRPQRYQVASFDEYDVKNIFLIDEDYPVEQVREPYITDGHIKDKKILLLALQKVARDMYDATRLYVSNNSPRTDDIENALAELDSIIETVREMKNENHN